MIIEIALGIVLAVIILANLELIFSAAIWLAVAAVGLGVAGAVIYWFSEHPEDALVLLFLAAGVYVLWLIRDVDWKRWFREALYRLGWLAGRVVTFRWFVLFVKNLFKSAKSREHDRRKNLGYDD